MSKSKLKPEPCIFKSLKMRVQLSGRLRCQVADHHGRVIQSTPWQSNLLLDQGMDNLAEMAIADIFLACAKGTDSTATSETVDPSNTYGKTGTVLARTAGTRDFSEADVGKHFVTVTGGFTGTILEYSDPTSVVVDTSDTWGDRDLVLWHVQQTKLEGETETEDAGGPGALTYKSLGSNVVSTTGDFALHTDIVGKAIYFPTAERSFLIASLEGDGTLLITLTGDDFAATDEAHAVIYEPISITNLRSKSRSDIYSSSADDNGTEWSGEVTGVGAHPDHIKTLTRTYVFDAVTDPAGETIAEVGFSHLNLPGNNLNIRVRLATPVVVLGPVSDDPGQQLRVQYQMVVTFPTAISGTVTCPISDSGNLMSSSKSGKYAIEGPLSSSVTSQGESLVTNPVLDPYFEAQAALSTNADDLIPLGYPTRPDVFSTDTVAQGYVPGSFEKTFVATFGVNEAISINLRTLMLYSETSSQPAFTFLFTNKQTKDNEHALIVRFTKTWSRTLSP